MDNGDNDRRSVKDTPTLIESHRDTLVDSQRDTFPLKDRRRQPSATVSADLELPRRYEQERLLGAGGMGQVWLCRDDVIGRRVALKRLLEELTENDDSVERFLVEARVQGRLEHPSVVPVYDLDADEEGSSFFTMKRVQGVTLDQVLRRARKNPGGQQPSLRRLLTAFSQVCLAVHYAHCNGVMHGDLKPNNIMLGEFGEVYVLDWGLARGLDVMPVPDAPGANQRTPSAPLQPINTGDLVAIFDSDELLGTPAYMSPEQMKNLPQANEPQAEVFALGAVLFEILTLEQLNQGKTVFEILARGVRGLDARPSARAPGRQVPAELERICVQATALDPADRHGTARALHEAMEGFLDGERNEQLRRELAADHARSAADAVEAGTRDNALPMDRRRQAMRSIGRALALDPDNEQALEAMTTLLTRPPDELPREVDGELQQTFEAQWRWSGWAAGLAYLSLVLYLPMFSWSGIRNVPAIAIFFGLALVSAAGSFTVGMIQRPRLWMVLATMCTSTLCFASTMTLFGPLFVTPGLIASNTAAYVMLLRGWSRVAAVFVGCVCMGGAILLEAMGLPWSSYVFTDAGMTLRPGAISLPLVPTLTLLAITSLTTILTSALSVSRMRDALTEAERRVHLYAWQIRQLVPAIRSGTPDVDPPGTAAR